MKTFQRERPSSQCNTFLPTLHFRRMENDLIGGLTKKKKKCFGNKALVEILYMWPIKPGFFKRAPPRSETFDLSVSHFTVDTKSPAVRWGPYSVLIC